jgi:hypothetical protein
LLPMSKGNRTCASLRVASTCWWNSEFWMHQGCQRLSSWLGNLQVLLATLSLVPLIVASHVV